MQDRISTKPNRMLITPETGQPYYATVTRADEPTQEGTALNKATFLKDTTAKLFGLGADAVPDDVFVAGAKKIQSIENFVVEEIGTSCIWTAPKAVDQKFKIYGVGGGGGGGGYSGSGGGGGYVEIREIVIPKGTSVNIICGAGGSGGINTGAGSVSGKNGGNSSFGSYFTANGGKGGGTTSTEKGGDGGAGGGVV